MKIRDHARRHEQRRFPSRKPGSRQAVPDFHNFIRISLSVSEKTKKENSSISINLVNNKLIGKKIKKYLFNYATLTRDQVFFRSTLNKRLKKEVSNIKFHCQISVNSN